MAAECFVGCLGFLGAAPFMRAQRDWADVTRQLGKEYSLGEMIGSGAYGVVYAGSERATGAAVAVKLVDRSKTRQVEVEREAAVMRELSCAHTVGFRQLLLGPRHACLVMEHFAGGDLVEGLQRQLRRENAPVACERLVHVGAQMALAVRHLHSFSIVHRDVKGDNFMLDREDLLDPACRVALGDFGTARALLPGGGQGQRMRSAVGTKMFWAPEFYDLNYAEKVDIWATGVVMYSLLACRFPFKDEVDVKRREPAYPKRLSPECKDFLKTTLRKTEAKRASADELVDHAWIREEVLARAPAPAAPLLRGEAATAGAAGHGLRAKTVEGAEGQGRCGRALSVSSGSTAASSREADGHDEDSCNASDDASSVSSKQGLDEGSSSDGASTPSCASPLATGRCQSG